MKKTKYTDSLGHWEMYGPFGVCLSDCPNFTVEFSKEEYELQMIKILRRIFS